MKLEHRLLESFEQFKAIPERLDWACLYSGHELVIFSHQVEDQPYRQEHAISIDTGCIYGGGN